jgi:outer membrane receptor protein involved in Fe transport
VQLSVGWKYALSSDIELLFEPYYQQLTDLLVKQDGVEQTLRNTGEGYSWGVDTVATKRFSDGWSLQANYSYNKSRVKDAADSAYYVADFNRPHFVQLGGIYELDDRWSFSARWKWASGAPRDGFVINQNVLPASGLLRYSKEITTRNIDRYDGFSSVNFRADYRRQYSWTELVAFVDIINLLGSDNPSSAEFNERTGLDVVEDGESIILLGFKLQW